MGHLFRSPTSNGCPGVQHSNVKYCTAPYLDPPTWISRRIRCIMQHIRLQPPAHTVAACSTYGCRHAVAVDAVLYEVARRLMGRRYGDKKGFGYPG